MLTARRRGFTRQVPLSHSSSNMLAFTDSLVNGKVTYSVKMLGRKEVPEPKGSHVVRDAIHAIRFQLQVKPSHCGTLKTRRFRSAVARRDILERSSSGSTSRFAWMASVSWIVRRGKCSLSIRSVTYHSLRTTKRYACSSPTKLRDHE